MKMLKMLREKKKLTQQQLADLMGVSRPAYSKWEICEREPDYATLVKLADFFAVTTDYLLGKPFAQISQIPEENADPIDKMRIAMEQALNRPVNRADAETLLQAYDRLTSPK